MIHTRVLQFICIVPILLVPWWLNSLMDFMFPDNARGQLIGSTVVLAVALLMATAIMLATWNLHILHKNPHLEYDPDIEMLDPDLAFKVRVQYRNAVFKHHFDRRKH